MLGPFSVVLALIAVAAWISAVTAALGIAALSPRGVRLRSWLRLGRWDFAVVRATAGPAAQPLIRRYVASFAVFFAVVVVAVVVMFYAGMPAPAPAAN